MISLIVEDKNLPTSEVKQKDILDLYNLKQWQLDKMIAYGMKKGFFKFKGFIYQLFIDGEKVQPEKAPNAIELPDITKNGRKVKYFISDIVIDDNKPPKNTFKTLMTIYGEEMNISDFYERLGISSCTLKNKAGDAKSFTINGVLVKVRRATKVSTKYHVRNTRTGHTSYNQTSTEVIKRTKCKKALLTQIEKFGFSCEYWHFVIGREKNNQ